MIMPKVKTVGAYEAKTHLASLLAQVEKGREIVITRRERPIARLVPVEAQLPDKHIFEQIRAFRKRHALPEGETTVSLTLPL